MIYSGQAVVILPSNEELAGQTGKVYRQHGVNRDTWRVWVDNLASFYWVREVDMRVRVR